LQTQASRSLENLWWMSILHNIYWQTSKSLRRRSWTIGGFFISDWGSN